MNMYIYRVHMINESKVSLNLPIKRPTLSIHLFRRPNNPLQHNSPSSISCYRRCCCTYQPAAQNPPELDNVRVMIDNLKNHITSLPHNVDSAIKNVEDWDWDQGDQQEVEGACSYRAWRIWGSKVISAVRTSKELQLLCCVASYE